MNPITKAIQESEIKRKKMIEELYDDSASFFESRPFVDDALEESDPAYRKILEAVKDMIEEKYPCLDMSGLLREVDEAIKDIK